MTNPSDFDDSDDFESESEKKKSGPSEFEQLLNESFKRPQRKLSVGDKVRGEILSLGKEDVFVSTGTSIDGTVPRRELLDAQGQVTKKVGDVLDLYVTQVRSAEIKLSTLPSSKNIADSLEDAFDMMLPVEGRVVEVVKGGVRVNIQGKLAFCPISQLDSSHVETGEEFVGKKLEFLITQFSEGGRNVVVSRKKVLAEQKGLSEATFTEERKEGTVVSGKVKRVEPFGAFVEISAGVEGLLHVSEMSWSRIEDPNTVVKVGEDVVVKVLKTESKDGKLRISLSLKQVGPTPWENLPADIKEGAMIEGKVTRCMKFGAFVELVPGIEGLIPLSEMSNTQRVNRSDEVVKEGDRVTVKIKSVDPVGRRVSLSLKDAGAQAEENREDWKAYSAKAATATGAKSLGTLGGALGEQLKKALGKKS